MKKRLTFILTLLTVAVAGYLVMALEIIALRIIQARISGDIFSTGAVIGVVLIALSLGYWLGGSLTVRFDTRRIQAYALIFSGLWIFLLAGIPAHLNEFFSATQAVSASQNFLLDSPWKNIPDWVASHPISDVIETRKRLDPLFASAILFFFPSALLAMIGPCAVKMLVEADKEAGRVSGWVFALGSLGSIAGVLCTSFWLIVLLGITANLRVIGIVALFAGIFNLSLNNRYKLL